MFEQATRLKLRFPSSKGDLNVEQLWDVPLRAVGDFNLDTIARAVNRDLEKHSEESFVESTRSNPIKREAELKLDVVKRVIEVKLTEERDAHTKANNKLEREKLLKILAEKQEGKLSDLSEKELQKRINALG